MRGAEVGYRQMSQQTLNFSDLLGSLDEAIALMSGPRQSSNATKYSVVGVEPRSDTVGEIFLNGGRRIKSVS